MLGSEPHVHTLLTYNTYTYRTIITIVDNEKLTTIKTETLVQCDRSAAVTV